MSQDGTGELNQIKERGQSRVQFLGVVDLRSGSLLAILRLEKIEETKSERKGSDGGIVSMIRRNVKLTIVQ